MVGKGCDYKRLQSWYKNQDKMIVYLVGGSTVYLINDGETSVCTADSYYEALMEARAYADAMEDITAPEIRLYVERIQHETAKKLGLPGLGARQKETLGLILDICHDALGKDRYLD